MQTWMYFALLGSHVVVAWLFYSKGVSDTVEQMTCEQQEQQQRKLWEQMTRQLGGDDEEDSEDE